MRHFINVSLFPLGGLRKVKFLKRYSVLAHIANCSSERLCEHPKKLNGEVSSLSPPNTEGRMVFFFKTLNSITLIYVSILMLVPHSFDSCSFGVSFEIRKQVSIMPRYTVPKYILLVCFLAFLKGTQRFLVDVILNQENTFWGLSDTGSDLTLIPRCPKCHYGPSVIVGAYGGQGINEILAQTHLHWVQCEAKPILCLSTQFWNAKLGQTYSAAGRVHNSSVP